MPRNRQRARRCADYAPSGFHNERNVTSMKGDYPAKRRQLESDGFCILENIIDAQMLARLRTVTDEMLARQAASHFEENRSQGSLVSVFEEPDMIQLVAYPPILSALAKLGFDKPKWSSGFVISKPAGSPPLFWHQDARFWDDPISYTPQIIQCFLMIYLVDTTPENGCLRLIPGSHLKRHPLHDALPDAHGETLGRMDDPKHLAFQRTEGEVAVPAKAGDVVMGSARLLHAAHGNRSNKRRTNITLWYYPAFAELPASIRAFLAGKELPPDWRERDRERIEALWPRYQGDADPIKPNRSPGPALK